MAGIVLIVLVGFLVQVTVLLVQHVQARRRRPIAVAPLPGTPRPILALAAPVAWWKLPPTRRQLRHLAPYAALAGTFGCWWIAAAEDASDLMSRGQWRLVGWALLVTAGALFWQSRTDYKATR